AFLGLGAIGRPMATRIAGAGHQLTVWNRTADRAERFAKDIGAKHAATPADAARGADVVITCFSTSADVAENLDGPTGIVAGLKKGAVLLDCTSGDPGTSRSIAGSLSKHGVSFLDAPVSGGVTGAEKGTLTVMVG